MQDGKDLLVGRTNIDKLFFGERIDAQSCVVYRNSDQQRLENRQQVVLWYESRDLESVCGRLYIW